MVYTALAGLSLKVHTVRLPSFHHHQYLRAWHLKEFRFVNTCPESDLATMAPCQPSQCLLEKVAIITGASSGLGRAIALAFAREGAIVVCADLDPIASVHMNDGDPKATHKIIGEKNGTSIFVKCNVDTSQNVQDLVNEAVQEYGRLDM